jgi:hypothetical protein
LALHATLAELPGKIARPLFGQAREFAEAEVSVIQILNQTGRNSVETNETQPAHHPFGAEVPGEKFLVTQSVLQGKQNGVSMQQRRNYLRYGIIVGCFDCDQDQFARADRRGALVNLRLFNMKIFLLPADANTETLDLIESTSDKEMNIAAANGELATVKAADRARSDNSDAKRVSHNLTS